MKGRTETQTRWQIEDEERCSHYCKDQNSRIWIRRAIISYHDWCDSYLLLHNLQHVLKCVHVFSPMEISNSEVGRISPTLDVETTWWVINKCSIWGTGWPVWTRQILIQIGQSNNVELWCSCGNYNFISPLPKVLPSLLDHTTHCSPQDTYHHPVHTPRGGEHGEEKREGEKILIIKRE